MIKLFRGACAVLLGMTIACLPLCLLAGDGGSSEQSWAYDVSLGTISDGSWTLAVTADKSRISNGLSVTAIVKQTEGANVLDFRKPAVDQVSGGKFLVVKIGDNVFKQQAALEELYLPEGFYSFGSNSFYGCAALKKVEPLMPESVESIGNACFQNSSIEGDLRLGFGTKTVSFGGYYSMGYTKLQTLTFGPQVKFGSWSFAYNKSVRQITFSDAVTSIPAGAFSSSSMVTNITPILPKSLRSLGSYAFREMPDCRGTIEIGTGDYSYDIPQDSFNGSGFDEIVFGPKFSGTINARAFANMKNLRQIRVLGDMCFTFTANQIFDAKPYQMIVHVPADNASWRAILDDPTQVTPWAQLDAETRAKFKEHFPNEPSPKGLIVTNWSTDPNARSEGQSLINRWITDDTAPEALLIVRGSPVNAGTPSIPYGTLKMTSYPVTCTMPEQAADGVTLYRTTGYTVRYVDADGNPLGKDETSTDRTFSYEGQKGGNVLLTWNFEPIAYKADLRYPQTGSYSVAVSVEPDYDGGYFTPGKTVTYTAIGEGFQRWYGDLGDADPVARSVTVTLDRAKTLMPYFPSLWTLSADGAFLTDGYWTLAVSGDPAKLTVNGFVGTPIAPISILDFSKPFPDGVAVVTFAKQAFSGVTALEELYLPETVEELGYESFKGCTSLKKVKPLLPDSVRTLDHAVFQGCPIEGDLRLGFGKKSVSLGWYSHFSGSHLRSVALGPNCKAVGNSSFSNCSFLKEIRFDDSFEKFDTNSFKDGNAVTNVSPCLPKSTKELGMQMFAGFSSCRGTLEIGTGDYSYAIPPSAFNGSGFDEVVFGPKFNGKIDSGAFANMKNLRQIRILGDLCFDFAKVDIFDDNSYRLIVTVPDPARNASWRAILDDPAQVTPWAQLDDETRGKFAENFPGVKRPSGLIVGTWSTQGATGPKQTLVNRWITYAPRPGFIVSLR